MDESVSYLLSVFTVLLFFVVVIGVPIFLIRFFIKRQKKKSNPLKKGVFKLTDDEEKKGVIGFNIAGIYYRENKDQVYSELSFLELGDEFTLEPEPENKHDEYAIKVLSQYRTHFGYVPRHMTYRFRDYKDNHVFHKCFVHGIQRGLHINVFIKCYPISALKS